MVWSINDRDSVNLDQVAWGHRRYPDHYVCWLVNSEQRYLGLFDDQHVFVAFVVDDVDCDLADLLRPGTGSGKRTAEIAKRQARLSRKITMANELAVYVFGLLAPTREAGRMRSKPSKAEAPPPKTKATEQPVVYDKEHGGADSRDHHAVEIESGHTPHS